MPAPTWRPKAARSKVTGAEVARSMTRHTAGSWGTEGRGGMGGPGSLRLSAHDRGGSWSRDGVRINFHRGRAGWRGSVCKGTGCGGAGRVAGRGGRLRGARAIATERPAAKHGLAADRACLTWCREAGVRWGVARNRRRARRCNSLRARARGRDGCRIDIHGAGGSCRWGESGDQANQGVERCDGHGESCAVEPAGPRATHPGDDDTRAATGVAERPPAHRLLAAGAGREPCLGEEGLGVVAPV